MKKHAGIAMVVVLLLVVLSGIGFFGIVRSGQSEVGSSAACPDAAAPTLVKTAAARESRFVPGTQPGQTSLISEPKNTTKVIAYYFHRTIRCYSCLTIEELSEQAIDEAFQAELGEGLLEYHAVNIEESGNEHFEKDYDLNAQSLVLVRIENGEATDWKNLKAVWDVFDDYGVFAKYVQVEVSKFVYGEASVIPDDSSSY